MPARSQGSTPAGSPPPDSGGNPFLAALLAATHGTAPTAVDAGDVVRAIGDLLGYAGVYKKNEQADLEAAVTKTASYAGAAVTGLGWAGLVVVRLDVSTLALADGADEADWFLQTSYNGGTDWQDLAQVHKANGDNGVPFVIHWIIGGQQIGPVGPIAGTDAGIADDAEILLPIGDRLRIKLVVTVGATPSVSYSAQYSAKAA